MFVELQGGYVLFDREGFQSKNSVKLSDDVISSSGCHLKDQYSVLVQRYISVTR